MGKGFSYKSLIIFLFMVPFVSNSQIKTYSKHGYKIEFNESNLDQFIPYGHSDTIVNGNKMKDVVKKDSLQLYTAKYHFEYENDALIIEKIEVYSKKGLIFSAINYRGLSLEKYSYNYDSLGRLVKRSGFSSGNSGNTTYYSY